MKVSIHKRLGQYYAYASRNKEQSCIGPTKSVFTRYVVPALGGNTPTGRRASSTEIENANIFLDGIPAEKIRNLVELVKVWQEEQGICQNTRRELSLIRKFVDWSIQKSSSSVSNLADSKNDQIDQEVKHEENSNLEPRTIISGRSRNYREKPHQFRPESRKFRSPNGTRRTYARDVKLRGKPRKKAFSLGCQQFEDYIKTPDGKKILANEQLQKELNLFKIYLQDYGLVKASIDKETSHLLSFYGWLHREMEVPLAELSLQNQVPVYRLYYLIEECLNEEEIPDYTVKLVKQEVARDKAKRAARTLDSILVKFLNFLDGRSEQAYIGAFIYVAKFQYHMITDTDQYDNFQDIPFVQKLRLLRKRLDRNREPAVSRDKKSVPWPDVLMVMEHLRQEADTIYLEGYYGPGKKKFYSNRRKDVWIAKSLQKFLITVFLSIIPPDRSRTIQELEIGHTMLRGILNCGHFIPVEKLDDPSTASWWLYLPPTGYKTGKKYGAYWSIMPNVQFQDGKFLYEYIDRWLTQYRSCFPANHNRFFTRHGGKPVTAQSLWEYHRDFFMRIVGVPVPPQELRSSFTTYLYDIGVPDYELDAVAFSMHHSRMMQESHYRKQKNIRRTNVAINRSLKIAEQIIGIRSIDSSQFND